MTKNNQIFCDGLKCEKPLTTQEGRAIEDFKSYQRPVNTLDLCKDCADMVFGDGIMMGWQLVSEHEKGEVV